MLGENLCSASDFDLTFPRQQLLKLRGHRCDRQPKPNPHTPACTIPLTSGRGTYVPETRRLQTGTRLADNLIIPRVTAPLFVAYFPSYSPLI